MKRGVNRGIDGQWNRRAEGRWIWVTLSIGRVIGFGLLLGRRDGVIDVRWIWILKKGLRLWN